MSIQWASIQQASIEQQASALSHHGIMDPKYEFRCNRRHAGCGGPEATLAVAPSEAMAEMEAAGVNAAGAGAPSSSSSSSIQKGEDVVACIHWSIYLGGNLVRLQTHK